MTFPNESVSEDAFQPKKPRDSRIETLANPKTQKKVFGYSEDEDEIIRQEPSDRGIDLDMIETRKPSAGIESEIRHGSMNFEDAEDY